MYFSTSQEMERLDQLAVEDGLDIIQMMELAGWHLRQLFGLLEVPRTARITIVVGRGNKGGDGLSAARHLLNAGYRVSVVLESTNLKADPAHHLALLRKMPVAIAVYGSEQKRSDDMLAEADVLVDALIGYHLDGAPRASFAELIERVNERRAKIVAYDIPSGVDATTGDAHAPAIRADATLTLALPKRLFATPRGRALSGSTYVADIGIPAYLYDRIAPGSRPEFGADGLLRVV